MNNNDLKERIKKKEKELEKNNEILKKKRIEINEKIKKSSEIEISLQKDKRDNFNSILKSYLQIMNYQSIRKIIFTKKKKAKGTLKGVLVQFIKEDFGKLESNKILNLKSNLAVFSVKSNTKIKMIFYQSLKYWGIIDTNDFVEENGENYLKKVVKFDDEKNNTQNMKIKKNKENLVSSYILCDVSHNDLSLLMDISVVKYFSEEENPFCIFYLRKKDPLQKEVLECINNFKNHKDLEDNQNITEQNHKEIFQKLIKFQPGISSYSIQNTKVNYKVSKKKFIFKLFLLILFYINFIFNFLSYSKNQTVQFKKEIFEKINYKPLRNMYDQEIDDFFGFFYYFRNSHKKYQSIYQDVEIVLFDTDLPTSIKNSIYYKNEENLIFIEDKNNIVNIFKEVDIKNLNQDSIFEINLTQIIYAENLDLFVCLKKKIYKIKQNSLQTKNFSTYYEEKNIKNPFILMRIISDVFQVGLFSITFLVLLILTILKKKNYNFKVFIFLFSALVSIIISNLFFFNFFKKLNPEKISSTSIEKYESFNKYSKNISLVNNTVLFLLIFLNFYFSTNSFFIIKTFKMILKWVFSLMFNLFIICLASLFLLYSVFDGLYDDFRELFFIVIKFLFFFDKQYWNIFRKKSDNVIFSMVFCFIICIYIFLLNSFVAIFCEVLREFESHIIE